MKSGARAGIEVKWKGCHDSIGWTQEKTRYLRLDDNKPLEKFVKIMEELKLAYPKFIDYAVPGNREYGTCPPDVPDDLQQCCKKIAESVQG